MQRLRRKRVATMKALRHELAISHMTVVRALRKYGYYTSVNFNAIFYTLHDIPHFDEDGLWTYRNICFSQHHNLDKAIVALVHNAPAGRTVAELEQRVNTKVANLLSRLCRQERLTRYFIGRQTAYLAVDRQRQLQQREQRDLSKQEKQDTTVSLDTKEPVYPPDCDIVMVLEVLIQIIKTPKADAAAVAQAVRARGINISAVGVQQVLDFYAIQKKMEHSPSPI